MLPELTIPPAQPARKVTGYEMPEDRDSLLGWEFVRQQMSDAMHYWLTTSGPDGEPHVAPLWGLWTGDRFMFDGSPQTKWGRNVSTNPRVIVHLPDAERVVIVEGVAHMLGDDELTPEEWRDLDSAYHMKYSYDEGSPFRYVEPTKVLAWDGENLHTMTRWIFAAPDLT